MSEPDKALPPLFTAVDLLRALLEEYQVADSIYSIREIAAGDTEFDGDSWDHPRVKRFSEIVAKAKVLLEENRLHPAAPVPELVRALYQDRLRIQEIAIEDLSLRWIENLCPVEVELEVSERSELDGTLLSRVLWCRLTWVSWSVTADRWHAFAKDLANGEIDGTTGWLVASGRQASEWVDREVEDLDPGPCPIEKDGERWNVKAVPAPELTEPFASVERCHHGTAHCCCPHIDHTSDECCTAEQYEAEMAEMEGGE